VNRHIGKLIPAKMIPMKALLIGAAVLSVALLVHAASSEARYASWWIAAAPWMAWIISPYMPLYVFGLRHVNPVRSTILYVLTVVVIGFAAQVYINGFFIHLHAQSALLFIFVPLYQWFAILVGGIVYLIIRVIRSR
jgi:hypothetical protein